MGSAMPAGDELDGYQVGHKRTLVIACGAISHELIAVIKANRWQHIDVQCLPAQWHNTPEQITPGVEAKIQRHKNEYDNLFVAYADCGTGGTLDRMLNNYDIERLPGDHCYSFFAGKEVFDAMAEAELGTFYLTDYLVDHFQRLVMDGLGITKHPELRDQYFGHYTRLMYLRQDTQGCKSTSRLEQAESAAQALGLELQIHDTGLTRFENSLSGIQITSA